MTEGVPVLIHVRGESFIRLERIAKRHDIGVARLIEQHIDASLVARRSEASTSARPSSHNPGHRLTPDEVALIAPMYRAGLNQSEIARRLGVSTQAIAARLNQMGLKR